MKKFKIQTNEKENAKNLVWELTQAGYSVTAVWTTEQVFAFYVITYWKEQ